MEFDIFPIQNASEYTCVIQKYARGHMSLWIRYMNKKTQEPPFYLYFSNVRYFSAPTSWKNGDFVLASPQDCESILIALGNPPALATKRVARNLKLFQIDLATSKIQIIASSVIKTSHMPS